MDVLYLGAQPKVGLCRLMDKAGHRIVRARSIKSDAKDISTLGAVVVHWRSKRNQRTIEQAKAAGIPVLVITRSLAAAVEAGDTKAELYLEEPVKNEELCALLVDLMTARQSSGTAPASKPAHSMMSRQASNIA